MTNASTPMLPRIAWALWLSIVSGPAAVSAQGIVGDPPALEFHSPTDSRTLRLLRDGSPFPVEQVRGWRVLVEDRDYSHMFRIRREAGALVITPSDTVEVGNYDLVINTVAGQARISITTPLDELPSILDLRSSSAGSVDAARRELGLTTTNPYAQVSFELPPQYYVGQVLNLAIPAQPGRTQQWAVNGQVVESGAGGALSFTFPGPGDYEIRYAERVGNRVVAEASARTTVVEELPLKWEVRRDAPFRLEGPEGYTHYVWNVDGEEKGRDRVFRYSFGTPGQYTIECTASGPADGPPSGFRRIRYETIVTSLW